MFMLKSLLNKFFFLFGLSDLTDNIYTLMIFNETSVVWYKNVHLSCKYMQNQQDAIV